MSKEFSLQKIIRIEVGMGIVWKGLSQILPPLEFIKIESVYFNEHKQTLEIEFIERKKC